VRVVFHVSVRVDFRIFDVDIQEENYYRRNRVFTYLMCPIQGACDQ
jgi:hypothetical protein